MRPERSDFLSGWIWPLCCRNCRHLLSARSENRAGNDADSEKGEIHDRGGLGNGVVEQRWQHERNGGAVVHSHDDQQQQD